MNYAPHILEKEIRAEPDRDENGNTIPGTGSKRWTFIGKCRCDDNGAQKMIGVGGEMVTYNYHIVISGKINLLKGDHVRALWPDGRLRGEGNVIKPSECNYFNYSEIWI